MEGYRYQPGPLPSHLPAVGQVVHRQEVVQAETQAKVTQAARQVALHQDVGALQVPVDYGHLRTSTKRHQYQNILGSLGCLTVIP